MSESIIDLRQKLLRKLKGGNKRFTHLNASIGRSRDKLDLLSLDKLSDNLSKEFINQLLTAPNLSFKIGFKEINSKLLQFTNERTENQDPEHEKTNEEKLETLKTLRDIKKKLEYLEAFQKEEFNDFGTKSFAFGYPLLIKRVGVRQDDIICAPLFIWYLDISRDYRNDSVTITRTEDNPILFNEMLDHYLATKYELDLSDDIQIINNETLNDGLLDEHELNDSLYKLLSKISSDVDTKISGRELNAAPKDKPAAVQYLKESGKPELLLNSGVFGVFKAGKQSIINDLKTLIQQEDQDTIENLDIDSAPEHMFSAIETDPSQRQVIGNLANTQNLIIQGPPGTGKSQTLTALITNGLANSRRTLVVCEKRTAMDIIARNLEKCGLGDYLILIENVNRDRGKVIEKARKIHESNRIPSHIQDEELVRAIFNYGDAATTIKEHHKTIASLASKGLGDNKTILGKYWQYNNAVTEDDGLAACRTALNRIPFVFDNSEFKEIAEEIQRVSPECVQSQTIIANIPRQAIVKNQSYQLDKESLTSYFATKAEGLVHIRKEIENYRKKFIDTVVSIMEKRHENAKSISRDALHLLSIEKNDFNWISIHKSIEKIDSKDAPTQQAISKIITNINSLQEETELFQDNLKKAAVSTEELINQHGESLGSIKKKVDALHNYGVSGLSIAKTESIASIFSSKQKDIKNIKTALTQELMRINKQKAKLPKLMGTEIILDEKIESVIDLSIAELPNQQRIISYLNSLDASIFSKEGHAIEKGNDLKVGEFVRNINDEQYFEYQKLKVLLWQVYYAKIKDLISHFSYLVEVLGFENVNETVNNHTLELLRSMSEHTLDSESLQSEAEILASDSSCEKFPVLNSLKRKTAELLSNGNYPSTFTDYLSKLQTMKYCQDLLNFIDATQTDVNKVTQEIETLLYSYYKWCEVYVPLKSNIQQLVDSFIISNVDVQLWQKYFSAIYFERLVRDADSSSLLNNDLAMDKLLSNDNKIKSLLLHSIATQWGVERGFAISNFERGVLKFNSLYNKRGAPGQRRNSLRKIIDRDMRLFTALFPVVICNPSVAASLFKLEKNLFDVVLFDEASQLRLEDTYTSLFRGKVKIISGDEHQMPPSNYFQSASMDEDQDYESDENIQVQEILNSESLLEYAANNGYTKTMLKVHYRSDHQDLIEFSNRAFYDGQLMPIPTLNDYRPIEFHRIDGTYTEHCNKDEASAIVDWLSKYIDQTTRPSIGIATLNLYQTNLIKDMISEKRTNDKSFDELMSQLDEKGFFVKNLENVQGDERDIMLMSTTFGVRPDGKFLQSYGPLTNKLGYRLLNVLVTRAKHKFIVFTSIPDSYIDLYSDEINAFGKDGKGIFYAYLAYARAIDRGDTTAKSTILNALDNNDTGISDNPVQGQTESPFEEEVLVALEKAVSKDRIELQYKVGGEKFRIDMVVLTPDKNRPMLAIECDGYAYHSSPDAYLYDVYRQKILEGKGFKFYRIWSTNWFHDEINESKRLIAKIRELDSAEL